MKVWAGSIVGLVFLLSAVAVVCRPRPSWREEQIADAKRLAKIHTAETYQFVRLDQRGDNLTGDMDYLVELQGNGFIQCLYFRPEHPALEKIRTLKKGDQVQFGYSSSRLQNSLPVQSADYLTVK